MTQETDAQLIVSVAQGAERFAAATFGAARMRMMKSARDDAGLRATGQDGWIGLMVPEESGGAGQGLNLAVHAAQAFGRHLATLSYTTLVSPLAAVLRIAPTLMSDVLAGRLRIVPAQSVGPEPGVSATSSSNGWRIDGVRRAVYCGGSANWYLLELRHKVDPLYLLIPRTAQGLLVESRRTIDGLDVADLRFDGCIHRGEAIEGGDAAALGARIRVITGMVGAGEMLGLAARALELTLEHMKTRQQFGKPLSSFQALQFRVVDGYIGVSLARALVEEAARLVDAGAEGAENAAAAATIKTAEATIALVRSAVQIHGAMGFSDEHEIGLYLKRALALSVAWGHPSVWRRRLATDSASTDVPIKFRSDAEQDAAFRHEVRNWLQSELPERLRNLPTRPSFEDAKWWHRKVFARGWIAPNWPRAYGGMGASVSQQIILYEEFGSIGAPEISGQAIYHLGPILQQFGTAKQKQRHLPAMIAGDLIWCQGYSEPGAGSDLASLRTRAEIDGDTFIVNGSKIWTTWAHHADWMFALVRTNTEGKKQDGITFLLIDMKSPGVTCRPIRAITGEDEFAEVFLDEVRVPAENVVGTVNDGWRVANALLEKERLNGANPNKCAQLLSNIRQFVREHGLMNDGAFRDRLVGAEIDFLALSATYAQIVNTEETGSRSKADFAFAKLVSAELQQMLTELLVEAAGAYGACADEVGPPHSSVSPGLVYLQHRRSTIYGGSSKIQRLLIARRALGL